MVEGAGSVAHVQAKQGFLRPPRNTVSAAEGNAIVANRKLL